MTGPRYGSLFSGYGGLDLGVQSVLGGTTAWHCEIEKAPSKILAHHWPDVPNLGDITAVDWSAVEPIDVLTGGFPCQDVSHAGKRLGLKPGTRSGLWSHMAYAIDQLRPRLVVAENVRGLLSAEAGSDLEPCPWCLGDDEGSALRALGAVLGDLADLGYDADWYGVRASDAGAPHGRFRVFVFAWPQSGHADGGGRDWRAAAGQQGQARPSAGRQDAAADAERCARIGWTDEPIGSSSGRAAAGQRRGAAKDSDGAAGGERRLAAPGEAEGRWAWADARGRGRAPTPDAHGGRLEERDSELGLVRRGVPLPGGAESPTDADRDGLALIGREQPLERDADRCCSPYIAWGDYEPAIRRWERLTRPAPSPTEPGKNAAARLSPRFVEWMMGLPLGHVTDVPDLSRNDQLKALGNGVVPQQAALATWHWLDSRAAEVAA